MAGANATEPGFVAKREANQRRSNYADHGFARTCRLDRFVASLKRSMMSKRQLRTVTFTT